MGRQRTVDIVGNEYSFLTVITRSENYSTNKKWVCRCTCGVICETTKQRLENGRSKSCGCMKGALCSAGNTKHGAARDGKNCPTYQSYVAMLHRCYTTGRASYKNYGGRGIVVEPRWREASPGGYLNFVEDMGERLDGTTLDRIDNNGNYCKDNCRWATYRKQAQNRDITKTSKNTSKYRGVSVRESTGKFMVRVGNGSGGYLWIGEYESETEAAMKYNEAALKEFGKDAILNKIE